MYAIRSPYWVIRDGSTDRIDRLRFHIEQGDYFPFLATIINILGEGAPNDEVRTQHLKLAEDLRHDLIYLHERYDILPKKKMLTYTREKSMRFPKISTAERGG